MKRFRIVIIVGMLLLVSPALHAQTSVELLDWTRTYLDRGNCEDAKETYALYKEKVPQGNAEVEQRIAECGKVPQKTTPEIYIDLGLPSGTLWKIQNEEGFYNYEDAISTFGGNLPTKAQLVELAENCTWSWNGNGYSIRGPNGKSIVLPLGFLSCNGNLDKSAGGLWSSTPIGSDSAYCHYFYSKIAIMAHSKNCNGFPVRLVKTIPKGYVDLGLPSGTLWKNKNESGYYDYDQAVSSFGYSLPSRQQRDELFNECQWIYTGSGYRVIGPNGGEIYLPTYEGYRTCDGYWLYKGELSRYWIRPNDGFYDQGESAQVFYVELSRNKKIWGNGWMSNTRCELSSVRLVHN